MWKMLQKNTPNDYLLSGRQYSVKQFVEMVLKELKLNLNGWKRIYRKYCDLEGKCIGQCDKNTTDL